MSNEENREDLSKWPTAALVDAVKQLRDERDRLLGQIAATPRGNSRDPMTADQAFATLSDKCERLAAVRAYAKRKIDEAIAKEDRCGKAGAHDAVVMASVARRVIMILDGEASA